MSIETDSKSLEDPKDPTACHVFALYKLLANETQVVQMTQNYIQGNYGYGHAKQALFELILDRFQQERERFNYLMNNRNELNEILKDGASKAEKVASEVLKRVRKKLGFTIS
jgi:tryptophanyl-tRNA synthetase